MQWQIEDAMLHALDLLDAVQARENFDHDAVAEAERLVQERLAAARGR